MTVSLQGSSPSRRRPVRLVATLGVLVAAFAVGAAGAHAETGSPSAGDGPGGAADYAAAAREFGVPEPLLLAYAYTLSRWDDHVGAPSAAGGYGPLHLTVSTAVQPSGRGGAQPDRAARLRADPAANTLTRAATLVGLPAERLRSDPTANIRGGAALLADEARRAGVHSTRLAGWYPVVSRLAGGSVLAEAVFDVLRTGVKRTTNSGRSLRLAAQPDAVPAPPARSARAVPGADTPAECPAALDCRFVPAAYAWNNTADANDYGNYDPADRPDDGNKIRYIVIHDTEGSYDGTVQWFQNPYSYTSAHYVIRSSDGEITQMVRNKDVAWHAGNWPVNTESIGIEHEAVAVEGATWYTDAMYRASATLVRYLAHRYGIPLDRAHILGHDDVANGNRYRNSHWDPGPFWDWNRYMELLGATGGNATDEGGAAGVTSKAGSASGTGGHSDLVTITPSFATNRPPLTYCPPNGSGCRDLPAQPANTVLLRTEPRDDAPLLTDPVLGGGTTDIADWSNKAVAGRRYAVAQRRGDWTGIWYRGTVAWLPTAAVTPARGWTIRARAGAKVPVFAAALPEPAEWPAGTPAGQPSSPPAMTQLYTISGDQLYPLAGRQPAAYYYARFDDAQVPLNHTIIRGSRTYYRISFNHFYLYVPTSDVTVG